MYKGLSPSCTKGILSRIVNTKEEASMLLTDIAIHKGNSGGMLVDPSTGEVIGLAAFNAISRHSNHTLTMPRLNFSIPLSFLTPFVEFSKTQDISSLESYNHPSKEIRALWALNLDPPSSKPTPIPPAYTSYIQNLSKNPQSKL